MKRFRSSAVAVAIGVLAAATASSALAAPPKKIAFVGHYAGQASTQINGNSVALSATGTGTGTMIGAGKITGQGTGDSSQQPCIPFGGTGTITGKSGTITYKLLSGASSCGDEGGHNFTVKGYIAVLKATGKLAKAKGTLKFTGLYSHDDGSFSVKFTGTLKR